MPNGKKKNTPTLWNGSHVGNVYSKTDVNEGVGDCANLDVYQ